MGMLEGKTALVTGGSRGIGAAIVRRFAAEGAAAIAVLDVDVQPAAALADELKGCRIHAIACDVGDERQVAQAVQQAALALGSMDVLVNNAGILRDAMLHKMTPEQWELVLRVNLSSVYHTCRHVLPLMREAGGGAIVNMSSIAAEGNMGQGNYAATKAGMVALTNTIARENGKLGIRANCVAPGMVDTAILATVPQKLLDQYRAAIPLQRFGRPEEVASAVAFLAGSEASYITGTCLEVSGGYHF